jgi:hypothetical protein
LLAALLAAFAVACFAWERRSTHYERLAQLYESEESVQIAERWLLASRLLPGHDGNTVTCETLAENGISPGDVRALAHICDLIDCYSSLKRRYREAARTPWRAVDLHPALPDPE